MGALSRPELRHDSSQDTIAAIATPPGVGAIGLVRVSGKKAGDILGRIFVPAGSYKPMESHRVYQGQVVNGKDRSPIDEAMGVFFQAPRSYTREDMAEIYVHGGPLVVKKTLSALVAAGARLAEPGEFTRRAFLNGRIDLAQAEAVLQVIQSSNEQALKWAGAQLTGQLSTYLGRIRAELVRILAQIEAGIDFPEEDLDLIPLKEIKKVISRQIRELGRTAASYNQGRAYRDGLVTVIVGKPNVGKSSLFNALLKESRAITSAQPGTTRDFIEELIQLDGVPIRLNDTAGLGEREAGPLSDEAGQRARGRLDKADLALMVIDVSQPLGPDDAEIARLVKGKKGIVVLNKSDLNRLVTKKEVEAVAPGLPLISVSAKTGAGIEGLQRLILDSGVTRGVEKEPLVITCLRHQEALLHTRQALARAAQSLGKGMALEFIALDIKEALSYLGEITGEVTSEEVLDLIFSQFCLGK